MPLYARAPSNIVIDEFDSGVVLPGGLYLIVERVNSGSDPQRTPCFEFIGEDGQQYFSVDRGSSWLINADGRCMDWEILDTNNTGVALHSGILEQEDINNHLTDLAAAATVQRLRFSGEYATPVIDDSIWTSRSPFLVHAIPPMPTNVTWEVVPDPQPEVNLIRPDKGTKEKEMTLNTYHTWLGLKEPKPLRWADEEINWIEGETSAEINAIIEEWYDHPFKLWIRTHIYRYHRYDEAVFLDHFDALMAATALLPSKDDPSKVAFYPDKAKREANRRVKMRPGKAFRQLFPDVPETRIDQLVDFYKREFIPANYEFTIGESRRDFRHAYESNTADMQNIYCSSSSKSLANSCMQGMEEREWERWGKGKWHPCEVYASGDFEIACLWMGKILAARTICHKESKKHAPIYAHGENAINELKEKLKEKGYEEYAYHGDFKGARLLKIKVPGTDAFLAPYLDLEPKYATDDGEFLIIGDEGPLRLDNTSGRSFYSESYCACCDDRINTNDAISYGSDYLCTGCYEHDYFTCEMTGEVYHLEEAVEVWRIGWHSNSHFEETWSAYAAERHASECAETGQLWRTSDMITTHDGELISPEAYNNCGYETCCLSGKVYYKDDMADVHYYNKSMSSRRASLQALQEDDEFYEKDGEWFHISLKEEEAA